LKKILLATAAIFAVAGGANASIIPVLESVTPSGSNFEFTYSGTLASDAGVVPGSQLVIFDFAGFTGFGDLSPSLSGTIQNTTPVIPEPGAVLFPSPGFTDDPNLPNLVFTYIGPAFHNTGGPYPAIDFTISAFSKFSKTTLDGFSAITVKNNGDAIGTAIRDVGATAVPTAAVPEPATWAMMIMGFGGMGALARRRRQAHVAL